MPRPRPAASCQPWRARNASHPYLPTVRARTLGGSAELASPTLPPPTRTAPSPPPHPKPLLTWGPASPSQLNQLPSPRHCQTIKAPSSCCYSLQEEERLRAAAFLVVMATLAPQAVQLSQLLRPSATGIDGGSCRFSCSDGCASTTKPQAWTVSAQVFFKNARVSVLLD